MVFINNMDNTSSILHGLIPDIDIYYQENFDMALSLINEISNVQSEFIKIAICTDNPVLLSSNIRDNWMGADGKNYDERLFNTFSSRVKSTSFTIAFLKELRKKFSFIIASIYNIDAISECSPYVDCIKIPSTYLSNYPLIREAALYCKNLIFDFKDFDRQFLLDLLEFVYHVNSDANCILQFSPSRPPASPRDWALFKIHELMAIAPHLEVGLSEHSASINQSLLSIGTGISFIEKGIMIDSERDRGISDSAHCLPLSLYSSWHSTIHESMKAFDSSRQKSFCIDNKLILVARQSISLGQQLTPSNTYCMYGENGLSSSVLLAKKNTTAKKNIDINQVILESDVSS